MSMIFCPQCGTENDEMNSECRACAFDFNSGTVLICPICQYENHSFLDKCKQCGTDLTAVSAVSDSSSEDMEADLARITGPLPAPPTRKFVPGESADSELEDAELEDYDAWLDEVIEGKSDDEFRGSYPAEGPKWAVGSGISLGDTLELEEEALPDWLKNLKEVEESESESDSSKESKMSDWLDESKLAQLERTRDFGSQAEDQGGTDQSSENGGFPKGVTAPARTSPIGGVAPEAVDETEGQDEWLAELAAMGAAADISEKEDEEDTRFVWDESALSSDLGEKSPGWLKELTESEDWPDTISESVIEEWTKKIDDDFVEPKDSDRFVTRPLGHTKELDGVPERLVSPALPEWLGEPSDEMATTESVDEDLVEEAAELQSEEEDEAFEEFVDWHDSQELTIEDTQEIEISGLPVLQTEEEPLDIELMEIEIEDSYEIEEEEAEVVIDQELFEESLISDEWLDDLAEAEDRGEASELEPLQAIEELIVDEEQLVDEEPIEPLVEEEQEEAEEQPALLPEAETESEVPTWLGRLTSKLLDTFDNEFVNEWFSRDKNGDGKHADKAAKEAAALGTAAAASAVTERDEASEPEAVKPSETQDAQIDPFFGEAIPDWLRQSEAAQEVILDEFSGEVSETPAPVADTDKEGDSKDHDKIGALIAAGAAASSDEWLSLLDRQDEPEQSVQESPAVEEAPQETAPEPISIPEPEEKATEDFLVLVPEETDEELHLEELHLEELHLEELHIDDHFRPIGIAASESYLVPDEEAVESPHLFTITREQRQQVELLKKLTSAEPRAVRPIGGQIKAVLSPNVRITLGILLVLLILAGWLIPTAWDPLNDLVQPSSAGYEEEVFSSIQAAAGKPILVAFEYTPAMAGELNVVADPLLNQMAANGSPVLAISQVAAGTAMADSMLNSIEGLESSNLGFLPGEAIGLRRLALCLTGDGSCETILGQPLDQEAVDSLRNSALILVLASDREAIINWIEQVGTTAEQDIVAGIIQPLQPVVEPYVISEQLEGTVAGAQSALAYREEQLGANTDDGFKATPLILAYWFSAAVMVAGFIYYAINGSSTQSTHEGAA